MSDIHYYETNVSWKEGRVGNISVNGKPDITVATPPEFPKGVPNIWSPEDLLVASVNTCVMTTFLAIADNSNLSFTSYSSDAKGKLEKVDGKFMMSEIELKPRIVVTTEKDQERAKRIIEKAEHNCLISNSVKTKVILSPEIVLEETLVNP